MLSLTGARRSTTPSVLTGGIGRPIVDASAEVSHADRRYQLPGPKRTADYSPEEDSAKPLRSRPLALSSSALGRGSTSTRVFRRLAKEGWVLGVMLEACLRHGPEDGIALIFRREPKINGPDLGGKGPARLARGWERSVNIGGSCSMPRSSIPSRWKRAC